MKTAETNQSELFGDDLPSSPLPLHGKDELNLAEFPLSALSHRVAPNQKTLKFSDAIWDRNAKQKVERCLTITAADKYGLPTALDDEVILGLVQISKRHGFSDRKVHYSKYELLQILGWSKATKNYQRVSDSLDRWLGITLEYQNAWWDSEEKVWRNEKFHILDRLTDSTDETGHVRDAFVWNGVVFASFQQGNLKALDLNLYRQLNSAIAKRLYRLLDKRFYHRRKVEFDLVELAYHKLGLSQNAGTDKDGNKRKVSVGVLKQRLAPAIKELVAIGFIKPANTKIRYLKYRVGEWHVIFEKAMPESSSELPLEVEEADSMRNQLEIAGVSPQKARRLTTIFPEDYLKHKMEVLRYLLQTDNPPANPGGFLVKSIEEDYAEPPEFKSQEQLAVEQAALEKLKAAKRQKKEAAQAAEQAKRDEQDRQRREAEAKVDGYLESLPASKRDDVVQAAYDRERKAGHDWIDQKGTAGDVARSEALKKYVLGLLQAG